MKEYMFYNPVKYLFGKGATEKIGTHAAALGKKALLVTYPGKPFDQFSERIQGLLADAGVECVVFAKAEANPMASTVREGADFAFEQGCDLIIGLGGGSSMDTAKGIAFMTGKEGDIFDYITAQRVGTPLCPSFASPPPQAPAAKATPLQSSPMTPPWTRRAWSTL